MTLPCLLIASAPQIDLQAFIKGLVVRQGRGLWVADYIYVYVSVGIWDCAHVCASEARPSMASRSRVPQSAVSLQLQSNRTATKCSVAKTDFPLKLPFLQPHSLFFLLFLFVFNWDTCTWNKNILNYISLQLQLGPCLCCPTALQVFIYFAFWIIFQAIINGSALNKALMHNDRDTCVCKYFSIDGMSELRKQEWLCCV